MDNLFTSSPLLQEHCMMEIFVIGTLKIDRVSGIQNHIEDFSVDGVQLH